MNFEKEPVRVIISARVRILNEQGKFLLVKRSSLDRYSPLAWEFPGGKLDNGEGSKVVAAKREVTEEVGLGIEITKRLGFVENISDSAIEEYKGARFLTYFYEATLEQPNCEIALSSEHCEHKWLTSKEALGLPLSSTSRQFIKKNY